MIANAMLHKLEVAIEQRFSLANTRRKSAANRQAAAKVMPVGRRRARRQHLAEHCYVGVGVENLAQYIGAGSLGTDHYKQASVIIAQGSITITQDSHRKPRSELSDKC
jgi:hypothetical protein